MESMEIYMEMMDISEYHMIFLSMPTHKLRMESSMIYFKTVIFQKPPVCRWPETQENCQFGSSVVINPMNCGYL